MDFDSLYNVQCGKHFYQFYKQPEDYFKVMVPFLGAGLEKGQACLWLVSRRIGLERVYDVARQHLPNFSEALPSGQLEILCGEDWYLTDGLFDEEKAFLNASKYLERIHKRGFTQFRASGDGASVPQSEWPKVRTYEAKVNVFIRESGGIALCAYPILQCTLSDTKAVLDTHDEALVGHF